jgi:hypothetical protein
MTDDEEHEDDASDGDDHFSADGGAIKRERRDHNECP